jgi:hypothetical protein
MGSDVAFWDEGPKCKYSAHAIYRRLRRGLPVQGLRSLPRRKAEKIIHGLLRDCRRDGSFFEGAIDDTPVVINLKADAILADFPLGTAGVREAMADAFADLGVSIYDPLAVRAPSGDHLYDDDYAEVSRDPDLGYWVELDLTGKASHSFAGRIPLGAQVINGVEYVFFKVAKDMGVFNFYGLITSGKTSIAADRLSGGNLDGFGTIAVVVVVPAALIRRYSKGYIPREHVRLFTAFADDDKVLYYQEWWPNDAGLCATVTTLGTMPKRMKTLITARFVHRG